MADEKNLNQDENKPPGLSYLYSSFLNPSLLQPYSDNFTLLKIKEQNIFVRIETDLETCHQLFEEFSPKKTLFELWGFRYAFYLGYKHQPIFMIFEKNQQPVGLLPLWYEKDKDELRWFGSWWQEGNRFWFKDKSLIPIACSLFPTKILLNALYISPRSAQKLGFLEDDPKYILDLTKYPSIDAFLQKFPKKKRYNLRRDQKLILNHHPRTIINRFEDIEKLFELSIQRFANKDGSAFTSEERKETFRQIIRQAQEYQVRMISTEINHQTVGVDLIALHKGVYYALNGAYDIQRYPGLGNYTNLLLIQDALNLGCKAIDFLEVSYGWKEDWFEPLPLFQFKGILNRES